MLKQAAIVFSATILGMLTLFAGTFSLLLALRLCPTLLYLSLGLCLTLLAGHLAKTIVDMLSGD
jgi:hypothetical protein